MSMAFERCDEPAAHELVMFNLRVPLDGFGTELRAHRDHWLVEAAAARQAGLYGRLELSRGLAGMAGAAIKGNLEPLRGWPENQFSVEYARRRGAGALSILRTAEGLIGAKDRVVDAELVGSANLMTDGGTDPDALPTHHSLHMPLEAATRLLGEVVEGWHFDAEKELFVQGHNGAHPTPQLRTNLLLSNIEVDFSTLVTVRPYAAVPA